MSNVKTIDYDRLASSAPVNRGAAVARDGGGEHFDVSTTVSHWKAPPPTKPAPNGVPDLTGNVVGRLRVIGYLNSHPRRGAAWLVRCSCGDYEYRRSKSILNPSNTLDRCQECRKLQQLKRNTFFWATGKNKPVEALE
jgi:hypothetical protein